MSSSLISLLVLFAPASEALPVRLGPASGVKDAAAIVSALAGPIQVPVKLPKAGQPDARPPATCAELGGELLGDVSAADVVDERPLLSERVHCRALLWLRAARPARQSFLGPLPLTVAGVGALPAALRFQPGPARARPGREPRGTWRSVDSSLKARSPQPLSWELRLQGRDYEALVSIYARGDLDGDGIEDALVRRDAFVTEGTYQEFAIFLVTRVSSGAPLKVVRAFSQAY